MTTQDERHATTDGVAAIQDWTTGYVKRHPLESLKTVGEQFMLGVRTIQWFFIDLFTGQFQWQEFVRQGAFQAGTAVVPVILVTLPIGVTLSIQFALLAGQVGATSLAGAASGIAIIRQAASLVAALLMSAAVGSAITADLGSRTMREETDAMEVMGVSVIRRLVVPRFAAAIMIGIALTGVVCFVGFLGAYLFNVYWQNGAPGSFVTTFSAFATPGDMILALIKAVIYGAIVAVVACQKGLSTKGGTAQLSQLVLQIGATTKQLQKFPSIAGTDTSGHSLIKDANTIAKSWNDIAQDPTVDINGLNRQITTLIKSTPSNAISVRVSIDKLVLGSIPDAGFKGDVGSHGPKRYNWAQLVGSFKYTLWRLQERVVGKGVYGGDDVPMRPSPTEPGVIERVPGPPPGAAPPGTSNPGAPVPPGQADPASAPAPGAVTAPVPAPAPEVMGQ